MLDRRIILLEDGTPIMETKTNEYTTYRRKLNKEELAAFNARRQAEAPPVAVSEAKEGAETSPPEPPEKPAAGARTRGKAKTAPPVSADNTPGVGAPEE
jgi:hypothetical protein